MFALAAALLFVLALIFQIAGVAVGSVVTVTTLALAGLLAVALHLAGVGAGWSLKK
ncbi:hypothetical protein [Streptosporangium roseum]|uniref:Uncharacterized protein n=1 Tax=Streptosporangium roseum (strain ATCC 12428 / DSM 43021 / JCM 3005 / KCTC 9067 / NCIMB 10171 / NRRL 2505 / NI 9100) TaxID=479432 RepID=D2ATT5_STRRD|nr:hypothetical protein [Streptosporangium roseum]ACZ88590.1 hypothetical protein Sros_5855 [Streptosporangium roseum DSM 43021]